MDEHVLRGYRGVHPVRGRGTGEAAQQPAVHPGVVAWVESARIRGANSSQRHEPVGQRVEHVDRARLAGFGIGVVDGVDQARVVRRQPFVLAGERGDIRQRVSLVRQQRIRGLPPCDLHHGGRRVGAVQVRDGTGGVQCAEAIPPPHATHLEGLLGRQPAPIQLAEADECRGGPLGVGRGHPVRMQRGGQPQIRPMRDAASGGIRCRHAEQVFRTPHLPEGRRGCSQCRHSFSLTD